MKRNVRFFAGFLSALAIAGLHPLVYGQEKQISIIITEDDEVVVDTSFALDENQDPEAVKEMIAKMTGEDAFFWTMHHGDDFEYEFEFDDEEDYDFNHHFSHGDSVLKGVYGNVLIFKGDDGTVKVMKHPGIHKEVIIMKEGKDTEEVWTIIEDGTEGDWEKVEKIKSGGEHEVFIFTDDEGVKKKVVVKSGEGVEWVTEGENIEVIIDEDGETRVIKKKIEVEVVKEDTMKKEEEVKKEKKKEKEK